MPTGTGVSLMSAHELSPSASDVPPSRDHVLFVAHQGLGERTNSSERFIEELFVELPTGSRCRRKSMKCRTLAGSTSQDLSSGIIAPFVESERPVESDLPDFRRSVVAIVNRISLLGPNGD